jgi:hypothetical protein
MNLVTTLRSQKAAGQECQQQRATCSTARQYCTVMAILV